MNTKESIRFLIKNVKETLNNFKTEDPAFVYLSGIIAQLELIDYQIPEEKIPFPSITTVPLNPYIGPCLSSDPKLSPIHTNSPILVGQDPKTMEKEFIKKALNREEVGSQRMVDVEGGSISEKGVNTLWSISSNMPIGAKTFIGAEVYKLIDSNTLVFDPEETEKWKKRVQV